MRKSKLWRGGILFLLLFGFAISFACAQERTVTGNVTSEEGESLPGVNIVIKGTPIGTITNFEGNYSIDVPEETDILVFSFVGFITQEIQVANQTTIDVVWFI